jgi:putative transposase
MGHPFLLYLPLVSYSRKNQKKCCANRTVYSELRHTINLVMPCGLKRFQEARCLHFVTFSCCHRASLLSAPRARDIFEQTLERTRQWYGFYVAGYVVMPEHVHLLVTEPERAKLSVALQMLKQNVARQLREPEGGSFWQARYYDFNVRSEAKRIEKLRYIHRNPVRRGLVASPELWSWSSFRHYVSGVEGVVEIESQWTARKREVLGIIPQVVHQDQIPRPVSPKNGETRTGHPRTG